MKSCPIFSSSESACRVFFAQLSSTRSTRRADIGLLRSEVGAADPKSVSNTRNKAGLQNFFKVRAYCEI